MKQTLRLILAAIMSLGVITVAPVTPTVSAASGCSHQVAVGLNYQVYGMRSKCATLEGGLDGGHEWLRAKLTCTSANGTFVHRSAATFSNNTWTEWVWCGSGEGNASQAQDEIGYQYAPWP